jgi:adenylate kinase family enzyme
MKQTITMIVGVPGSGKTWITSQLGDDYLLVHHDAWIGDAKQPSNYVQRILDKADGAKKPILIEAPFSISQIKEPLEQEGYKVECVFIQEPPEVVSLRYFRREKKIIPKGHLTRQATYAERAKACRGFSGTSTQVLEYLKSKIHR